MSRPAFAVALCLAVSAFFAGAPLAEEAKRPKIGLVLSGGGALGIAHVGVIQELERHGIRPDFVVGTSMGAVVGGLYASGYTGDELEQVVNGIDWSDVFNDTPPRSGLSFRQKRDEVTFPVKPRVRVDKGRLQMPAGLISDQNLMLQLRALTRTKSAVASFDELPIPFRAVATDIETGNAVTISRGNLATAMRASMSVPGVFPAVEIDGHLLVDGGLANNIPVDVAKAMGADIVIAVALRTKLKAKNDLGSAFSVLGQTVSLLILKNETEQLAKLDEARDILIEVDVADYTASDFGRGRELMEPGREAARRNADRLSPLSGAIATLPPQTQPVIEFVEIANTSPLDDEVVRQRITVETGKPLDIERLNENLTAIYAIGAFQRVDYDIVRKGGATGLLVKAEKRPDGLNTVRLGLSLTNDFEGESAYAFSADYTATALTPFGAEARFEGVIGDRLRLFAEYFQPLDPMQSNFISARADLQSRDINIFSDGGFPLGEYRARFGLLGLDIGHQFEEGAEIRLGIERGIGKADLKQGTLSPARSDIDVGQIVASAGVETLDSAFFPRKGVRLAARYRYALEELGAREDSQSIDGLGLYAVSAGKATFVARASGGTALTGSPAVNGLFRLGGQFSLSGLNDDELSGEAFALGTLIARYKINDAAAEFLGVPLYAGISLEGGNAWADAGNAFSDWRTAGSVFVAADTGFGPVYLAIGHADEGRTALALSVGRTF